jgi:diacylglycerol kinase (ATP)
MRSAWIVHNPAAGRFPAEPLVLRAADVFREGGWSVRLETATRRDHLLELVQRAVEASSDVLIAAGGDGTVGLAASLLRGTSTALAVLPTGTSNVWAKDLGVPQLRWGSFGSAVRAARSLLEGEILSADLGEANGRVFLLWAGTGLDARVVNLLEPRRRLDKILPTTVYALHTVRSAWGWGGARLEVEWPDGRARGTYIMALASNIPSYGGGLLKLSPEARIDDGRLDFWLLKGQSVGETVIRLLQVVFQRHHGNASFVHFQAGEAEFRAGGPLPMHFDGEPGQLASPVRLAALPGALRVLAPAGQGRGMFSNGAAA